MLAFRVIELFPKQGDDWITSPPIPGLNYTSYAFVSNGGGVPPAEIVSTPVYSRLTDWEEFSNEIDFITQTRSFNANDKSEVKGVGGLANLKDFKFGIRSESVDIIKFMGCTVKVWDVKSGVSELKMTATIDSSDSDNNRVEMTVKGKFAMNESVSGGKDSPVTYGQSQYIPLSKRSDDFGNTRLIFDPEKHSISGIFVKEKKDEFSKLSDEPRYFPVGTDYVIAEDQIIFKGIVENNVTLKEMDANVYGKFVLYDYAYILAKFEKTTDNDSPPSTLYYQAGSTKIYYTFDKKTEFYGTTYALYKTGAIGSYEPVISHIYNENAMINGDTVQPISLANFVILRQPRVPLQLMHTISYWDDDELGDPLATDYETLTDWILSGRWKQGSDINNRYHFSLDVSRQQSTLIPPTGGKFSLKQVNPWIGADGEVTVYVDLQLLSKPDEAKSFIDWEKVAQSGDVLEVLDQDSSEDAVDISIQAPYIAEQNYHPELELSATSGSYNTYTNSSEVVAEVLGYGMPKFWPLGEAYRTGFTYNGQKYITKVDLLFDIPNLSGDVREAYFFGDFDSKIEFQLGNVRDNFCIDTWLSLSGQQDYYGNRVGEFEYFNSNIEGGLGGEDLIPRYSLHYKTQRVRNGISEYFTGAKDISVKLDGRYMAYKGSGSKPVHDTVVEGKPVTLSDWRRQSISINSSMYAWGETVTSEAIVKKDDYQLWMNREMSLSFLIEARIQDNEFYALVEDTNLQDLTNPEWSQKYYSDVNVSLAKITDNTICVLRRQKIGNSNSVTLITVGQDISFGSTYVFSSDTPPVIARDIRGRNGLFYGSTFKIIEINEDPFDWKNESVEFRTDITDRDGKLVTENWVFYLDVEDENTLKIFKRVGLNNSRNPVTIAYNLLTKEMGYPESDLKMDQFKAVSLTRDDYRHSIQTTQSTSTVTLLRDICKESGIVIYEDEEGQFSLINLDPPSINDVNTEFTSSDLWIEKDSFNYSNKFDSLGYLISDLTVRYGKDGSTYTSEIGQGQFPSQDLFNLAKSYLSGKARQCKMSLDTVFEQPTAVNVGQLNMNYHSIPIRYVTFPYHTRELKVGEWFKVNSGLIEESAGKLFLPLKVRSLGFVSEVKCFVYDPDLAGIKIQEVPTSTVTYEEVPVASIQIQEVP